MRERGRGRELRGENSLGVNGGGGGGESRDKLSHYYTREAVYSSSGGILLD